MISLIDYRSKTIFRAFVTNSLAIAIITSFSIELRRAIDVAVYSKNLPHWMKIILTMIGTFILAMFVFSFLRLCLNFGDGLLATTKYTSFF